MPQRSNEFQKLIYLVQANLADGAKVTESEMLVDSSTGRHREVDVCITGTVGGIPVRICIECRDHARPADVTWVDEMKAKHERLPTNALILASKSGFTEAAKTVARGYRIQTISLDQVETADFGALLGITSSLWARAFALSPTKVMFTVVGTSTTPSEDVAVDRNTQVFDHRGLGTRAAVGVVHEILRDPHVTQKLLADGRTDHVWFQFRWENPRDMHGSALFLKKIDSGTLREIERIDVEGHAKFSISGFSVHRGMLGPTQIAWGSPQVLGQDALMVAARDRSGSEKVSISIRGQAETG